MDIPEVIDTSSEEGLLQAMLDPAQRLNRRQAAAAIGVSPITLERWAQKKVGLRYFRPGKSVFYLRGDLARFLSERFREDAA